MGDIRCQLNLYTVPSEEILQNRREFYALWRRCDDQTPAWLKRVESCIRRCQFPMIIEYLLIDRFVCGLNSAELRIIQSADTWAVEQLMECFQGEIDDTELMDPTDNRNIDLIQEEPSIDIVKSELSDREFTDETEVIFVELESILTHDTIPKIGCTTRIGIGDESSYQATVEKGEEDDEDFELNYEIPYYETDFPIELDGITEEAVGAASNTWYPNAQGEQLTTIQKREPKRLTIAKESNRNYDNNGNHDKGILRSHSRPHKRKNPLASLSQQNK